MKLFIFFYKKSKVERGIVMLALLLGVSTVWADDISEQEAQQLAIQFCQTNPARSRSIMHAPANNQPLKMAYKSVSESDNSKTDWYVFDRGEGDGFVIVTGNDATITPILGYSDKGRFDYDHAPCNLKALLSQYTGQIQHLRQHPEMRAVRQKSKTRAPGLGNVIVEPLVKTTWNQDAPYNNLCPVVVAGMKSPTGCGPTAIAQILAYWKYPKVGRGSNYYYWNPTETTRFDYGRDFSNSVYDWDNMLNGYAGGYNETQADAIALLMADVGAAVHCIYGAPSIFDGSGTHPFNVEPALVKYFDYKGDSLKFLRRFLNAGQGETDDFDSYLKHDLDMKRPALLGAQPSPNIQSHFIVVDGYTDTGYFHMNFGWEGTGDGYYLTTAIDVDNLKNLEDRRKLSWIEQDALVGICPTYSIREGDNYFYTANDQAILSYSEATKGAVTIPATIAANGTTYPVTKIGRMACYENENLTSAVLPLSIKEIGERAFYNCCNFSSVTTEDQSTSLTGSTLSNQLTTLGEYAFARSGLTDITVPASISRIADYAFYRCDKLTQAVIYSKEVGTMSFGRCSSKPEVFFYGETLGDGAFFYDGISYIYLGDVKHMGNDCLSGSFFDTVTLDKIETMGWNPSLVKSGGTLNIGKDAPIKSLRRNSPLDFTTNIVIDKDNPNFVSTNNVVYSKDMKTLIFCGWKEDHISEISRVYEYHKELNIPETVERINDFAIIPTQINNPLKKLTIPASVKLIGIGNFPPDVEVFNYATTPQPVKLLDESYYEGCRMEDELIDVGASSYGTTEYEIERLMNDPNSGTLHVPAGSRKAYAAADVWKNFANIVDDLPAGDDNNPPDVEVKEPPTRLVVWLKNGDKAYFDLNTLPETSFGGGKLTIKSSTSAISYQLGDVLRYTYDDNGASGIEEQPSAYSVKISEEGEDITFRNLKPGTIVKLFSLGGVLLEQRTAEGSKPLTISIQNRPSGVYVVKADHETIKLMKP